MTQRDAAPRSPGDDKADMRRQMVALRNGLSPDERGTRSSRATECLIDELERGDVEVVMAFVSIRSEIDASDLLQWVLRSGRRLVLPRTVANVIEPVETKDLHLVPGSFGVPEPVGPAIEARRIDTVIAPGLAFDRDGRRLGYGAGCYDRFLLGVRSDTPILGWCFAEQIVAHVPTDEHDLAMTTIISDEGVEFDGRTQR